MSPQNLTLTAMWRVKPQIFHRLPRLVGDSGIELFIVYPQCKRAYDPSEVRGIQT